MDEHDDSYRGSDPDSPWVFDMGQIRELEKAFYAGWHQGQKCGERESGDQSLTFEEWVEHEKIERGIMPSTDTHDIYARTSFWNGIDREPYNCSADGIFLWMEADLQRIDATLPKNVIYYFGPKVSS